MDEFVGNISIEAARLVCRSNRRKVKIDWKEKCLNNGTIALIQIKEKSLDARK